MEDGSHHLSSTIFLARTLSVAGHPFFLVPFTVAIATRSLFWTAIVTGTTTLPMLGVIARRVRRGAWSDYDVSRRDQRSSLYAVGLPLLAVCALILYFLDAHPMMLRSVASGSVMLLCGLLGNRWLKISLHMMFAGFCSVMIAWLHPQTIVIALPAVAAIAWSRRTLDRHTWPEIATGLTLGTLAGLYAVA